MAEVPPGQRGSLPLSARVRLDEACDRFDDAWKTGARPRLEDFLGGADGAERQALLKELLRVELELRHEAGERPEPEEYQRRFPGHEDLIREAFAHAVRVGAPAGGPSPSAAGLPAVRGYQLLGVLGEGGMGVVYKARQLRPSRLVALKMIRAAREAGPAALPRFRTEYESVARLAHPQIVQIYEVGEHDGLPFFSMELAEGGSLHQKLAGKPLPARPAAELLAGLARAVQHAHEHGVVHRDLKPANVVLTGCGAYKITDFGLAKLTDSQQGQSSAPEGSTLKGSLTLSGTVLGTPAYMAPEQARGELSGQDGCVAGYALVDVYALGAVLYALLTGRPPFVGKTPSKILERVRSQDPTPPRALNRRADRALEAVCLKCLEKEPRRRYASARELAEDLERWLQGRCPTACRWPLRGRWLLWRHRRAVAALALFGVASLLVLSFFYFTNPQRALDRAGRELAAGRPVTLVGQGSGPSWARLLTLESEAKVARSRDGEYSFQASHLGLLELLPDPQRTRYRFSAEVRQDAAATEEAEVGVFSLYSRADTAQLDKVHCFWGVGFNDHLPPLGGVRVVKLFSQQYRENAPGIDNRGRSELASLASRPALPTVGRPGPWRKITVEVTPEKVRAFWGAVEAPNGPPDELLGESALDTLRRRARFVEAEHARKKGGRPILDAPYAPRSPLGLYVHKSSASARRVVIEPLED
jgi:serine/threonine protein kinase